MNKWIPSIITLVISVLIIVFVACGTRSGEDLVETFAGSIVKYQYGNITYLVFDKGNGGVAVVNYTSDSLEYEFLHSPTKTYHDTATSAGLIYSSNGILKEVR